MALRQFDFVVGPTTSEIPTTSDPSLPSDLVTLSYAQEHFLQGKSAATDTGAIRDFSEDIRTNGDIVYCISKDKFFRYDFSSSASEDDSTVLQPTTGPGRWLLVRQGLTGVYLGTTDTQDVSNKSLKTSCVFSDASTASKQMAVSLSGSSSSTTATLTFACTASRAYTFPDATLTVLGEATTQDVSNKSLKTSCLFSDASTASKQMAVSLSGSSSSTIATLTFACTSSRAYTFPDATTTIVGTDVAQSLSNKTLVAGVLSGTTTTSNGGTIRFLDSDGSNYAGIKANATTTANLDYTLPAAGPTVNGAVLTSTTAGAMSWSNSLTLAGNIISSLSNSGAAVVQSAVNGSSTISGTAQQVVENDAGRQVILLRSASGGIGTSGITGGASSMTEVSILYSHGTQDFEFGANTTRAFRIIGSTQVVAFDKGITSASTITSTGATSNGTIGQVSRGGTSISSNNGVTATLAIGASAAGIFVISATNNTTAVGVINYGSSTITLLSGSADYSLVGAGPTNLAYNTGTGNLTIGNASGSALVYFFFWLKNT